MREPLIRTAPEYQRTWNSLTQEAQELIFKNLRVFHKELDQATVTEVLLDQIRELQHLVYDLESRISALESKKKKG